MHIHNIHIQYMYMYIYIIIYIYIYGALSMPKARAAAVGSLMIRGTFQSTLKGFSFYYTDKFQVHELNCEERRQQNKLVIWDPLKREQNPTPGKTSPKQSKSTTENQEPAEPYRKSQVAQNNRLPYPKVAHNFLKATPKNRPLAFQVRERKVSSPSPRH